MADKQQAVLFVEDALDTRDLVEYALRHEGLAVTTARTADEGLTAAREQEFAVILLDIGLPDKDGLALCRDLRALGLTTPILLYTAYSELLDPEEVERAGAQRVLRKPEDTAALGSIVRSYLADGA
ncbi:MAG TPA: response regulator [Pyrinomonadaceae bacterium]|nr:response regulator [Pyrinomonadaceae bacterium]